MDRHETSATALPRRRLGGFRAWGLRICGTGLLCVAVIVGLGAGAVAQGEGGTGGSDGASRKFLRIASGAVAGSYFRMADVIAGIISHPPGSGRCADPTRCGPEGLIAVAQASEGSVRNVVEINGRAVDTGLAQADVVDWAYRGMELFEKVGPQRNLRAIATLYPETIHLVVGMETEIRSLADLKGKRVSIDRPGSGTNANARLIFEAMGFEPGAIDLVMIGPGQAASGLSEGTLDAFFFTAGAPVGLVTQLVEDGRARLVPIAGTEIDGLMMRLSVLQPMRLASGLYPDQPAIETVSVGALWIAHADVPEDLIYDVTRALWNDANRAILVEGHPLGDALTLDAAARGLPVPLHPGAERFYRAAGVLADVPLIASDPPEAPWPEGIPRPIPRPDRML